MLPFVHITLSRITFGHLSLCLLLFTFHAQLAEAADFAQCFQKLKDENSTNIGATFDNGTIAPYFSDDTTGITYHLCLEKCGADQEAFDWSTFSQQFSSWLLPWLALISQLPFTAGDATLDVYTGLLSVGSPTLAAYSVAITALNGRWITGEFDTSSPYDNLDKMRKILAGLQQVPLILNQDQQLLASLVVLKQNEGWFDELTAIIEQSHSWSISAAANIGWVVVAYLFTVGDSFNDVSRMFNSSGQAVGAIWLWLIPVVVGWLQIAPKISSQRLYRALEPGLKDPTLTYVAAESASEAPKSVAFASDQALFLAKGPKAQPLIHPDAHATAPIFNYARWLHWSGLTEDVVLAYKTAASNKKARRYVDGRQQSDGDSADEQTSGYREGTREDVTAYCFPSSAGGTHNYPPGPTKQSINMPSHSWAPDTLKRFLIASAVALGLQWATTGSAIIIVWFTPTTGLACRSAAYLAYGVLSTVVWFLMVSSSFLFHSATMYCQRHCMSDPRDPLLPFRIRSMFKLSDIFLALGRAIAAMNALGIFAICIAQFSHVFHNCYCDSSVIFWGEEKAYCVINISAQAGSKMKSAWAGALALAMASVFGFILFISVHAKTKDEKQR